MCVQKDLNNNISYLNNYHTIIPGIFLLLTGVDLNNDVGGHVRFNSGDKKAI